MRVCVAALEATAANKATSGESKRPIPWLQWFPGKIERLGGAPDKPRLAPRGRLNSPTLKALPKMSAGRKMKKSRCASMLIHVSRLTPSPPRLRWGTHTGQGAASEPAKAARLACGCRSALARASPPRSGAAAAQHWDARSPARSRHPQDLSGLNLRGRARPARRSKSGPRSALPCRLRLRRVCLAHST